MELYLVRHGETEWSRARRHTGRTDLPLSAAGEAEAAALGRHLRGLEVDRVLSSPLTRACRADPAGRVRRPPGDHLGPARVRLRRIRGHDHPRDPRHPARVGPVPRRLPRRRDGGDRRRAGPATVGGADHVGGPGPAVLPRPPAPHPDRLLPRPAPRRGQAPVPGHGQPVGPRHRARVAGHPPLERAGGLRRPRAPRPAPPAGGASPPPISGSRAGGPGLDQG